MRSLGFTYFIVRARHHVTKKLHMIADGATLFTEIGPGKVLQGLIKKVDKNAEVAGVKSFE